MTTTLAPLQEDQSAETVHTVFRTAAGYEADRALVAVPEGWELLPSGRAAVTRRVRSGPHWVVRAWDGYGWPVAGTLAPAAAIAAARRPAPVRRNRAEEQLAALGPYGQLLVALRRAQAASDRAKTRAANGVHALDWHSGRGAYSVSRSARDRDYETKDAALAEAVQLLADLDLSWGWGKDEPDEPEAYDDECWSCDGTGVALDDDECRRCGGTGVYGHGRAPRWVLYIDLPGGQVSYHAATRHPGPDYPGEWDGQVGATPQRIDAAIASALAPPAPAAPAPQDPQGIAT